MSLASQNLRPDADPDNSLRPSPSNATTMALPFRIAWKSSSTYEKTTTRTERIVAMVVETVIKLA